MPDAYNILHRNVYGWFVAIERGVYDLTEAGRRALLRWPQMVSPPDLENPVIDASRRPLPHDQPRVNLAKALKRQKTEPMERCVKRQNVSARRLNSRPSRAFPRRTAEAMQVAEPPSS